MYTGSYADSWVSEAKSYPPDTAAALDRREKRERKRKAEIAETLCSVMGWRLLQALKQLIYDKILYHILL